MRRLDWTGNVAELDNGHFFLQLNNDQVYMVLTCALVISKGFDEGTFAKIKCT
jgi:hypothetical protein